MRLEERACGPAAIDINYLREHTNNEVRHIYINDLGSK